MALANYSDLKESIETWSKRQDVKDKIDDFIDLAEVAMYSNTVEPIRIRAMQDEATGSLSTSVRTLALPTGFIAPRRFDITVGTDRPTVPYVTPDTQYIRANTGRPNNFTVTEGNIVFDIIADQAYTYNLIYFKKLDALDSTNTTNAILTNHPDVYLFGGLMQLYKWAEDEGEFVKYEKWFYEAISAANSTDEEGNRSVAPQRTRRRRSP